MLQNEKKDVGQEFNQHMHEGRVLYLRPHVKDSLFQTTKKWTEEGPLKSNFQLLKGIKIHQ